MQIVVASEDPKQLRKKIRLAEGNTEFRVSGTEEQVYQFFYCKQ